MRPRRAVVIGAAVGSWGGAVVDAAVRAGVEQCTGAAGVEQPARASGIEQCPRAPCVEQCPRAPCVEQSAGASCFEQCARASCVEQCPRAPGVGGWDDASARAGFRRRDGRTFGTRWGPGPRGGSGCGRG
ncbi:hypothetical protein OG897_03285 [Streptomyces sp. NBC_00237]|uniref:hypothetical protein n=1 Tax=Streptomyces sp. NBC_00237 TaxID=2975687 RepID=UPI00225B8664|nr:hypothetical protein [Streptomyces sp. NBC_00237]MCX5200488.1 hypothetical protein [Streptomyces sp. NBC_00237]